MPDYFDKSTGDAYNAFVNYYIHQVNAMRFLLGEPYKVTFADKSGVLMAVESTSGSVVLWKWQHLAPRLIGRNLFLLDLKGAHSC